MRVVIGCGVSLIIGLGAQTALAQQGPIGTYYVSDAGVGFPRTIWARENGSVTRTSMSFQLSPPPGIVTETGPLAVYGNTVATTGNWGFTNRQAQVGEIFTRGTGGTLTTTNQFTTNLTTTETFLDGTSDGTYNYMIGFGSSAQGTIYRCGLDWSNPTPVANMGINLHFTGITYDNRDNTFWVAATTTSDSFMFLYHIALPSSPGLPQFLGSRSNLSAPGFVNALAMDLDYTLWGTVPGGTMYHFDTDMNILGSFTPTDPATRPFGGEIAAAIPAPGTIGLLAVGAAPLALRRRRRAGA